MKLANIKKKNQNLIREFFTYHRMGDIVDDIELKIKVEKLYKIISEKLDDREKKIIIMRYGLGGNPELTQREIAKKLNISRSYVSRIEKKALETMFNEFK